LHNKRFEIETRQLTALSIIVACSIGESVIAVDVGSGRDDDGNDDPVIPVVFYDGGVAGRDGGERRS